jgi:hypothetical protein
VATSVLNPSDQLHPGQPYTFVFNSSGINPFVTGDQMTADLAVLDFLDGSTAYFVGNGFGPVYVRFTYGGDGTDSVDSVASDIISTIQASHSLFYLSFSYASAGTQTAPTIGSAVAQQAQGLENVLPSQSTLVIIVVGIALIAFIMSGGPGIIRGVSEGARA